MLLERHPSLELSMSVVIAAVTLILSYDVARPT